MNFAGLLLVITVLFAVVANSELLPPADALPRIVVAETHSGAATKLETAEKLTNVGTCTYESGSRPPNGDCVGPLNRLMAQLQAPNHTCKPGQVSYYKDGDINDLRCGTCVPGDSGVESDLRICKIEEYCADDATCVNIDKHPLFGKECSWEQGGPTSSGWCGAGLRCINHVCLQCESGVRDPTDGKACIRNKWTYSQTKIAFSSPYPYMLLYLNILLSVWCCFSHCIRYKSYASGRPIGFLARFRNGRERLSNTAKDVAKVTKKEWTKHRELTDSTKGLMTNKNLEEDQDDRHSDRPVLAESSVDSDKDDDDDDYDDERMEG